VRTRRTQTSLQNTAAGRVAQVVDTVFVQIEFEKYLDSFYSLEFEKRKPFTGSCYHGQLVLNLDRRRKFVDLIERLVVSKSDPLRYRRL